MKGKRKLASGLQNRYWQLGLWKDLLVHLENIFQCSFFCNFLSFGKARKTLCMTIHNVVFLGYRKMVEIRKARVKRCIRGCHLHKCYGSLLINSAMRPIHKEKEIGEEVSGLS